jgi:hypothetical protein
VEHPEDLYGRRTGLIDDEIGEDSIEQNRPAREIGPTVADSRHFGQAEEAFENLRDDPVRRFQAFTFQQVKPNTVSMSRMASPVS